MKITDQVAALAKPVVEARGCSLWDVEYVREGPEHFLRLYIDKEGGVVCSAGLERVLKRPGDFQQFLGSPITVKLYRPHNGLKELPAVLRGYEDGKVTVEMGKETITFEKSQVALVRLRVEF